MKIVNQPKLACGDVVFFKHCTRTNRPTKDSWAFKGSGFGIFFGALPPLSTEPTESDVISCMAAIGFVSFDDVAEHLGEEIFTDLVVKMEAKIKKQREDEAAKELLKSKKRDLKLIDTAPEVKHEPTV